MSLFDNAINYVRRLARPMAPVVRTVDANGEPQRPQRRRSRIRLAVKHAHRRVVTRLKQPSKHRDASK